MVLYLGAGLNGRTDLQMTGNINNDFSLWSVLEEGFKDIEYQQEYQDGGELNLDVWSREDTDTGETIFRCSFTELYRRFEDMLSEQYQWHIPVTTDIPEVRNTPRSITINNDLNGATLDQELCDRLCITTDHIHSDIWTEQTVIENLRRANQLYLDDVDISQIAAELRDQFEDCLRRDLLNADYSDFADVREIGRETEINTE